MSGKLGWYLLGGVCIAFGAVLLGSIVFNWNAAPTPMAPDSSSATPGKAPPVDDDGYVGSQVCGTCHSQVRDAYRQHPMARSLATPREAIPVERSDVLEFAPPGPRRYRIEPTKDGVRHHELMVDRDGDVLYDQAVDVDYVMGSGKRGRAYLIEQDGMLFKSSIAWFSTTNEWGLSESERHRQLYRRMRELIPKAD